MYYNKQHLTILTYLADVSNMCHRPAGLDDAATPRGDRCGHRGGVQSEVRHPYGLRGPTRRVLLYKERILTAFARQNDRCNQVTQISS